MTQKVVLASGNKGKLKEFGQLLSPFDIQIIAQSQLNVPEADETGLTFVENAIIKARNAAQHSGLPALADDSGIAIDALNGQPGIYSARYSGKEATDKSNIHKVLDMMKDVPESERSAAFHCVLVFMRDAEDPTPLVCHGSWHGKILQKEMGENGFGYDPIFYVDEFNCSAAQLPAETKNSVSHRAMAFHQLLKTLHP